MIATKKFKSTLSLLMYLLQMAAQVLAGTQFASHVSVTTPARSFTHGVGDPVSLPGKRPYQRQPQHTSSRSLHRPAVGPQTRGSGYPRVKPAIPFTSEDIPREKKLSAAWQYNYKEVAIPVLPPSPYKVDSPDPESLWPEGLFLPPITPPRFGSINRRSDTGEVSEPEASDPYLLEGSEAIAAVVKAKRHGHLYFHEIPHIESLLANQELRVKNNLKPHVVGSIRHTWPYNRP